MVAIPVVIGAGLGVRAALSGPIANLGGVALWATLICCLIVLARPALSPIRLFVAGVGVSFAVELFQLTPIPMALYRIHPASALVLGTSFEAADLPAYVVGSGLGAALQALHRAIVDRGAR